jgi:hypothetical protein
MLLLLALLVLAAPAGATGIHAKAASKPRCLPAHVRVVTADAQAAVYLAPEDPDYPEFLGVYGCSYKAKRSYLVGNVPSTAGGPGNGEGVELEALAGPVVADWYAAARGYIEVRDLANGRVLHRLFESSEEVIGPVWGLVVKSDGAVAWLSEPVAGGPYQVHAVDKAGSRVVAEGEEIEPHSLALAGSTLYWTEAGKPMSTTLN